MEVEIQENDLWRAGADIYAPDEYKFYKTAVRNAKDHLIEQGKRFIWFRDYGPVQREFSDILLQGKRLLEKIEEEKRARSNNILSQVNYFQERVDTLKKASSLVNEGRLSRSPLIKAEVLLDEAIRLHQNGRYIEAEEKLKVIPRYLGLAREVIYPILGRYTDQSQIKKWRIWVEETIERSRERGIYAIVVSKVDKRLTVYKDGNPIKSYPVGLGRNGYTDKLHAGDKATPEGRYYIVSKKSRSRFYKALVINYPNEDDRRQFIMAKKKGIISKRVGIGGLIEIHGGGKDGMTDGCISLENTHIDELFHMVDVGTPVTIVGATAYSNNISDTIKEL
ncbi:MAG: hypothetical protein Fur0020_08380 [Thermodesulfovibrionia bacterium]